MRELISKVRSGVVHINYMGGPNKIGSGSGFISKNQLVTNHHVIKAPFGSNGVDILLRFDNPDPSVGKRELRYTYENFMKFLVTGSEEGSYDYAVFNIPDIRSLGLFDFEIGNPKEKAIGDEILFLGYPLEHSNLVCHRGTISSFYKKGLVTMIQLDASVNQSNSGGPLVDPESGMVLGIITRKATGLTNVFDQLLEVFDKNIEAIKKSLGMMSLGGFDPVGAFMASQAQMKMLANEIIRSANVGIGYAVSIEHLADDPIFKD